MVAVHLIELGKIVGVHGVAGMVKVKMFSASMWAFEPETVLNLAGGRLAGQTFEVEYAQPYRRSVRLKLKEVNDRNRAEVLVGATLMARREQLPPTAEDEYYWFDLIGLQVVDDGGRSLGVLEEIITTGANDVYVVRGEAAEILIPAIGSVVIGVDLQAKLMRVDPPKGL